MNHTSSGSDQRPSRVRYVVVAAALLMATLLYLDRFCVTFAAPYIRQDLGLSEFQIGLFMSAFFLPYALAQVPAGWLSDRYGARIMLTYYIVAWSVFTALMGLAGGFAMLIVMRALTGLGQAGAYPTSSSIVSKWVPFSGRGAASSMVAFGGRLGGAIAPVLTAFLIVSFVPNESPSTLQEDDVIDLPSLVIRLNSSTDSDATGPKYSAEIQRIRTLIHDNSADQLQRIDELAESYGPANARRAALMTEVKNLQNQWRLIAAQEKAGEADAVQFAYSESDRRQLTAQLNRLIETRDMYAERDFGGLAQLDKAAITFMKRVNKGEELSDDESKRFNRLLLEGVFPKSIGKVYVGGWRPVLLTYGIAGFVVAAAFWFMVRNHPHEHPKCNAAELALIAGVGIGIASNAPKKISGVPWGRMLRSRSLWLSSLAQVGTNIGWVFLVTQFPSYLLKAHQVPILTRGLMMSIPLFVGWAGMLSGGRLTDALAKRFGVKWGRRLPWSMSRFIAMFAFLTCLLLDDPWMVTCAMAVVAFSTDLGTSSAWAFTQDVGGRHVGSILGWGNMWGNLGATISPILIGWAMSTNDWNTMFLLCAGSFGVAGCLALGIDATKRIAPPDDE
ncbi:MAG: MFS transporter [Planctomycetota bacterium]|nr:MFS transporter [Planctomycetota bacterium]